MSKNMSNKSIFSSFEHKEHEQEGRPAAEFLLRKDSTLKSFEFPEFEHIRSPFMMIDSPHFDQVPSKNSFNSWSYLFHHWKSHCLFYTISHYSYSTIKNSNSDEHISFTTQYRAKIAESRGSGPDMARNRHSIDWGSSLPDKYSRR